MEIYFNGRKPQQIQVEQGSDSAVTFAALVQTFRYLHEDEVIGLCPKCRQYLLLKDKVCFGCGYHNHL